VSTLAGSVRWASGCVRRQAWQGNRDVMIDRYDVRTHIDYIAEPPFTRKTFAALLTINSVR